MNTVLMIKGPRQSGKSTALLAAAMLLSRDKGLAIFFAPSEPMMRYVTRRVDELRDKRGNGFQIAYNFGNTQDKIEKKLDDIFSCPSPNKISILALDDMGEVIGDRTPKDFANHLAKKFDICVWCAVTTGPEAPCPTRSRSQR